MSLIEIWADRQPSFTPGGSEEFEKAAWETQEYRISCGWNEKDATGAYLAEMSSEGYENEREMEIG